MMMGTKTDTGNDAAAEATEEESHTINPLLIPHVASQILSYSSFQDLHNFRLVCTSWNSSGEKLFRTKCTLALKDYARVESFMDLLNLSSHYYHPYLEDVTLHLDGMGVNWMVHLKPFLTKYGQHIKSLRITHALGELTEDFLLQLVQGGYTPSLQELKIAGTVSTNLLGMQENFHLDGHTLSVTHLNIEIPYSCWPMASSLSLRHLRNVRSFFIDFFKAFPNLESLKFQGFHFPELFQYFPRDEEGLEFRFSKLKILEMRLHSSIGLKDFSERRIPLRKLKLDVDPSVGIKPLHEFLSSFGSTLEWLDLKFSYRNESLYSHNATQFLSSKELRNLKKLRIVGYWGDLYFLEDFERLESIIVERTKWDVAFPEGIKGMDGNKIKFFNERGIYCDT